MALSATVVFEVRVGGSDSNGGGFNSAAGGTDRSLQTAPHVVIDGATITCTVNVVTTNLDIAGYTTVDADVGNIANLSINGGALTLYQITAQTGGNQWTVDKSAGTAGWTGTGNMGGCFATPGKAAAVMTVDGHQTWVDDGTYTNTTATPGPGGPVLFATAVAVMMQGYEVTRGDRTGVRPILSWGAVAAPGATTYLFSGQGSDKQVFANLRANGNSVVNVSGFNMTATRHMAIDCYAEHCNDTGAIGFLGIAGGAGAHRCYATDCNIGFSTAVVNCCEAEACNIGFSESRPNCCLSHDNAGDGFVTTAAGVAHVNCTADNNGGDGFDVSGTGNTFIACLATNNGAYGYNIVSNASTLFYCASYNNTSGRNDAAGSPDFNAITITSDPYVNRAGGDFRLNSVPVTGGKLARNTGIGVYGQTDNADVGAIQHSDEYYGGAWGSCTLAKETGANARGGSGTCAKLTALVTTAYGYWEFFIPATASTQFTLSFYHMVAAGFNGALKISIFDTDNSTLLLTSETVSLTDDSAYHQHSCTPVTPTATGLCRVRLEILKGAAAAAAIYFDDFAIA